MIKNKSAKTKCSFTGDFGQTRFAYAIPTSAHRSVVSWVLTWKFIKTQDLIHK